LAAMTPEERKEYHQANYRRRMEAESESQRARCLEKEREARRQRRAFETPVLSHTGARYR
jgi:hypothetical protein